jgi:uncharacterized RDD family membrane protein YckC
MKRKTFFWLRLASVLIDSSVIYSISICLQPLLWKLTFIGFGKIFIVSFLLYYTFSYFLFNGHTVGKTLTGLRILRSNGSDCQLKQILVRELVFKWIAGIFLPFFFLPAISPIWSPMFSIPIVITLLLLSALFLLFFKRTWWEMFSKTTVVKETIQKKIRVQYTFASAAGLITLAVVIIVAPFLSEREDIRTSFYPHYPATDETRQYAGYIKQHTQKPEDYIFDLFRQYDLVVLSERMHPEYTQYELISKIISDERFIKNIGNIFTECGSVSFQDTLNTYLHTRFATEDDLNKSTAILQRNSNAIWPLWSNTNLFDLLKTVNKLNSRLPDSLKINWRFTDLPVDWRNMTHEKYYQAYTNTGRDSIMADHVIEPFQNIISGQKRHKALVIMNTRHGYSLIAEKFNRRFRKNYTGTAAFIMRNLPGKVATVMLNTVSLKLGYFFMPVQQGKWETAFSLAGNPALGFNFSGSPFGNDDFDLASASIPGLTYKDVFTGFVFYKPLKEHIEKDGFFYEFENFEDTIIKRAAYVSKPHVETIKMLNRYYQQNRNNPVATEHIRYFLLYNLVNKMIVPILLCANLVISFFLFIKRIRRAL